MGHVFESLCAEIAAVGVVRPIGRVVEVARGTLLELANRYADTPPRGEIVVVVGPPEADVDHSPEDLDARLRAEVESGASIKDAAALVAAETGHPRRDLYARALKLFREEG